MNAQFSMRNAQLGIDGIGIKNKNSVFPGNRYRKAPSSFIHSFHYALRIEHYALSIAPYSVGSPICSISRLLNSSAVL